MADDVEHRAERTLDGKCGERLVSPEGLISKESNTGEQSAGVISPILPAYPRNIGPTINPCTEWPLRLSPVSARRCDGRLGCDREGDGIALRIGGDDVRLGCERRTYRRDDVGA